MTTECFSLKTSTIWNHLSKKIFAINKAILEYKIRNEKIRLQVFFQIKKEENLMLPMNRFNQDKTKIF